MLNKPMIVKYILSGLSLSLVSLYNNKRNNQTNCDDQDRKYVMYRIDNIDSKDIHPDLNLSKLQSAKIIHFVRHAQGEHNVAGEKDPLFGYLRKDLEDAKLTEQGLNQCTILSKQSIKSIIKPQLLIVSPMTRTLQTATFSFPKLMVKIPWIALENIREQTGLHPCDKRRSISYYKTNFPHVNFDKIIDENDPLYDQYIMREPLEHVVTRCYDTMAFLSERPEKEIIIVTHRAFLRHLFDKVIILKNGNNKEKINYQMPYDNCEVRSYFIDFKPKE